MDMDGCGKQVEIKIMKSDIYIKNVLMNTHSTPHIYRNMYFVLSIRTKSVRTKYESTSI